MKEKRFYFGLVATAAWLAWMGWQLHHLGLPKELNEQGDLFAGFFAPLAFLWLVLGYLQQGDELRQSTEALRLQAEELKNSVKQQSELVAVSKEQIHATQAAFKADMLHRRREAQPIFQLQPDLDQTHWPNLHLIVFNAGRPATRVFATIDGPASVTTGLPMELKTGDRQQLGLAFENFGSALMRISYVDANGERNVAEGPLKYSNAHPGELFVSPQLEWTIPESLQP